MKMAFAPVECKMTVNQEFVDQLKVIGDKALTEYKEQHPEEWEIWKKRFPHLDGV
jgi:hypothetical protein